MNVNLEEFLRRREDGVAILDVRSVAEYDGRVGPPCDARWGHVPGAVNVPLDMLLDCVDLDAVRSLVGLEAGVGVIAYCHSGNRSAFAANVLREAGYDAANYLGSWHEWSSRDDLPVEAESPGSGS